MTYLKEIMLSFCKDHSSFSNKFSNLFKNVIEQDENKEYIKRIDNNYLPRISLNTSGIENDVTATFFLNDGFEYKIIIENKTGLEKNNHLKYSHIEIDDLINRFKLHNLKITKIDHVGFNLPWFSDGNNPEIQHLRKLLSNKSLYHTYPSGEPWDFILPATLEEIKGEVETDYSSIRKPKFEIVSFSKCSVPIIQFDVCCSFKKEMFQIYFPEGCYDVNLQNIWLYIVNPFQLDICLVLSEEYEGDWSYYFKNSRLT